MDRLLRSFCLWIAALAGVIALGGVFYAPVRAILVPATIFAAARAAFLFVRMLFSGTYRRGVGAACAEMQGSAPWPGRPKGLFDPEWGLFGRRAGSPALLWVRAVLVLGLMPIGLLQSVVGEDVIKLWFAGTFISIELSLMHAALQQRSQG